MDFDELRELWNHVGRTEAGADFERRLLRSLGADNLRSTMNRVRVTLWLELLCAIPVVLLTGSYLADNFTVLRYAVPAVALHLAAIAMIGIPVRQLYMVSQIDFADPVVTIQRRIGTLRVSRVKAEGSALVLAPLLWTPLSIVGAHGFLGIDLYEGFGWPWILANLALGVSVLVVAVWASRRHGDRIRKSPLWKRIADGLAGRRLVEAQGFLRDLDEFEIGR
jgi:hypothetical protein